MKKLYTLLFVFAMFPLSLVAQTGTEFWFAAPEVTHGHNDNGPKFRFTNTSKTLTANVTVTMPAQAWNVITPTPIVIAPSGTATLVLDVAPNNYVDTIENKPTNTVLNKGIHITSDVAITAYFEQDNNNNNEIFALKGANGLGTEFYIPLTRNTAMFNHTPLTPSAYSTFDIVATQNATTVQIYTRVPVDGHPANVPFTITLNQGQTYSCGWTGTGFEQSVNQPSGAVVLSDKPIAITVKEDSRQYGAYTCYDLIGDQIVPVDIVGTEYVVIKGQLSANAGESFYVLATENNTKVYINGNATPVATLFAGQTYAKDSLTLPRYFIQTDKPAYCTQVTGFGCELGSAILPPLNCAGSSTVSFVRSTNESFYLNLMIKDGSQGNFKLYGGSDSLCITSGDFAVVPGTGGEWYSTYGKQFTLAQVPVGVAMRLVNSTDVFGMGLINGGSTSGCRYGFFSEFAARIVVDAGPVQSICSDQNAQLNGSVSGGVTTGQWTSSGTGFFTPNNTAMNAQYVPGMNDILNGSVTLTLTSTGMCFPETDATTITFQQAPAVNADIDQSVCSNNPNVNLNGSVANALGGIWSGGVGSFNPNNTTVNAVYTPTPAEVAAGTLSLTLTSTGNGICNPKSDIMVITFSPSPTAYAGADQTVCANNASVTLNGSVTVATGGIWTGGAGSYSPSNIVLGAIYTPSAGEIATGTYTLTLTTTGNANCNAVSDMVTYTITPAPIVDAGTNQTACGNNPTVTLSGSITNAAGGQWSGGMGLFSPNSTTLNATYTPTAGEISAGIANLVLTSTGNGSCIAVTDNVSVTYTTAPTINAGMDQSVCANNPSVSLSASVTIATGGIWSGGSGTYSPNNSSLNITYTPSAAEIAAGSANLTITSSGNGTCNPVSDAVHITITPAPTVSAGSDQSICANNANVTLNGSVTVATGGIWTGGAGSYTPSNTILGAVYTPSPGEIATGTFTLTLTSTGNNNCNAVSDIVTYTVTPAPIVDAGVNQTACGNNPTVTLSGSVINAPGGQWTGGLGIFAPSNNALNATYTPTAGEVAAGFATLTLTNTGSSTCIPVTDNITIAYTTAPTVNAGVDISVCANNPNTTLSASVTVATGVSWSGGMGSYIPNNTSLNITYIPTLAEISAGGLNLTATTTGNGTCNAVADVVHITITASPVVNAGVDYIACVNNPTVLLNGSVANATGGLWTGGNGVYNPSSAVLNATYTPTPLEISSGLVTLTLTSTGNGNCNPVADYINITFTPSPVTDAGPNQIKCANNAVTTLSGSVVNASGGIWSGGLGIFSPNNSALNATYTPTAADILAGSVTLTLTSSGNGTCNPVPDVMTISFTPSPTANAGTDLSVCANNPSIALNGNYTVASGAQWSGGAGTYSPGNTSMGAVYTPSAAEISAGGATLTLTTTGNGTCNAVSDNVHITITASPTANAGPDKMICRNNPNVNLHGLVTIATGGVWSGGAGVYNPNNADLNAVYTPTPAEIAAGSLTLTLTTTGNGNCYAVTDQITINFTPEPVVNAGVDQTVCANTNVNLFGTVVLASGGIWSGGLGLFTPGNNVLNPTYTPSTSEIIAGFVNLTLTSTGNGTCNAVSDVVRIDFTPAPTVSAGADQVVCANNAHAVLTGNVTIATGGIWTSSGSGSFSPNNISLNTTYNASAADIVSGSVTIRLTTTGNGTCNPVLDSMKITFSPAPAVQAGSDQTVCVDNLFVSLNGLISGGSTTGIWSTSGTGTFIPNNTMLGASYHASSADSLANGVTLYLTSTNNGDCLPVVDSMHIFIFPAGVANAGSDATVCANNSSVVLNGSVSGGAVGGIWSTSGNGTFVPNSSTLNATYNPGSADITAGTAMLILTANSCNQAKDTAIITITPAPNVDAGPDLFICSRTAPLNATISGATTTGIWTTSGTGTFSPDNLTLNATYNASMADSVAGTVTLILTSTGNGNCIAVKDTLIVTITEPGFVNAGVDQNVCSNVNVILSGSITGGASQGVWTTSGTGSFVPSNTAINASYVPSAGDITVGSVMLTLTATNSCNPVFDNLMVTFIQAPTSDAGIDQTVCANNSVITLNGISSNSSSVLWTSSGSGSFMPNATSLNVLYVPDAADISNGAITLYLSANGNGGCAQVIDSMQLTITPAPAVNAGMNQSVCITSQMTQLMGSVSAGSSTGIWTTLGSGSFVPDNVTMNTYYQFSSADTTAGSVSLILTSTNNGDCLPVSDTVVITFGNTTFVYAGPDQTMCGGSNLANLNGFVNGGSTSGQWITLGTGSFFPYDTVLNTIYIISPADSLNGSVDIILMSTYNGTCGMGSDTLTIYIDKVPEVNAGTDFNQCFGTNAQLNGSVLYASGGQWSSSGTGAFIPDVNTLNAQYVPSFADSIAGYVDLVLTTTGNGTCSAASDTIHITFLVPLIPDFTISTACLNQATSFTDNTTILSGSITSWLWDFGGGNLSNMQNASYVFTSTGTYMVTLTVQSNLGCSTSITKTVTVHPSPVAAFSSNTVCSYENMSFTDLSTVSSGNINAWMWDFGDGDTAYVQSPQHIYNDDSLYSVT
ncbi:MAG: PKD domain-containing protein, partial [Bacteroidota bacterium]